MNESVPRRRRVVIVPVDLGGSPHRCGLHPPRRPAPNAELVHALILHYQSERRPNADTPLEVAFFHGGVPHADLLEVAAPHSLRLACLPGDLTPGIVRQLWSAGTRTLEIDVASPHTTIRRGIGRRHGRAYLDRQLQGLRDLGFRVGIVLAPGLPGASHESAVDAAEWAVGRCDFVRIHPALAWRGATAEEWLSSNRWTPMDLGQAVTTVSHMMDRFEAARLPVARVGLQPGPDLPGRVLAGPTHPNLRALVETRRFRLKMREALRIAPRTRCSALAVHPADLSWARGTANENVRALRAELRLPGLSVTADPSVQRGRVELHSTQAEEPPAHEPQADDDR